MVFMCLILAVPLLLSAMTRYEARSKRIACTNNLKRLGLAFKTWGLNHGDKFPMSVDAQPRASPGASEGTEAYRYFQVMWPELANPEVLICPADTRSPAKDLGKGFSNANLSYFVGLDATDTNPQMFLLGDRNLTNGPLPPNHILVINTNYPVGWSDKMHRGQGNIALADGSVQQYSSNRLREALLNGPALVNRAWTNRLAFP
jgi:prepilin-type processing-associated H-X9-DG protein